MPFVVSAYIPDASDWYENQVQAGNPMLPRPTKDSYGDYRWGFDGFFELLDELGVKFIGNPNVLYPSLGSVKLPRGVKIVKQRGGLGNTMLLRKWGRTVAEIHRTGGDEIGWYACKPFRNPPSENLNSIVTGVVIFLLLLLCVAIPWNWDWQPLWTSGSWVVDDMLIICAGIAIGLTLYIRKKMKRH